jgi:hypothetical protein
VLTTALIYALRPIVDAWLVFGMAAGFYPVGIAAAVVARRLVTPRLEMVQGAMSEYLHDDHHDDSELE